MYILSSYDLGIQLSPNLCIVRKDYNNFASYIRDWKALRTEIRTVHLNMERLYINTVQLNNVLLNDNTAALQSADYSQILSFKRTLFSVRKQLHLSPKCNVENRCLY